MTEPTAHSPEQPGAPVSVGDPGGLQHLSWVVTVYLTWFLRENTLRGHDATAADPVEPEGSS